MFRNPPSSEEFHSDMDLFYEPGHVDDVEHSQLRWSTYDFNQDITFDDDFQNEAHNLFDGYTAPSLSNQNQEEEKEKTSSSLALLEFIKSFKPSLEKIFDKEHCRDGVEGDEMSLSTVDIAKIAAAYYVDSSDRRDGEASFFSRSFDMLFSVISTKEIQNIELTRYLFAAADKVGRREFDEAREFLKRCFWMSSYTGEAIERVVYHFADALTERIDKETKTPSPEVLQERIKPVKEIIKALVVGHPVILVTQEKLVAARLLQHTAIHTFLDNFKSAKKIHIIDLTIRYGILWTIMIQALSERSSFPVDYLKVTALLTYPIEETTISVARQLKEFADNLGIQFYFDTVTVSDLKELREDMFVIEADEVIGVYSSCNMSNMITQAEGLDNLMRVIRKMKPSLMVVSEVESNHNSSSFATRFAESFFFYAAYFDQFEACMEGDEASRLFLEGCIFSEGIKSIVAADGSERLIRNVGLDVWRSYFARFGMEEADLNGWSDYRSSLLLNKFDQGGSSTLGRNGKSMTIGWKGTPLHFMSAWKFL